MATYRHECGENAQGMNIFPSRVLPACVAWWVACVLQPRDVRCNVRTPRRIGSAEVILLWGASTAFTGILLAGRLCEFVPKVAQRMHLAALRASIAELDLRQRTPPGITKFKHDFDSRWFQNVLESFRWFQMVSAILSAPWPSWRFERLLSLVCNYFWYIQDGGP